jgi:hypothetical protein
VKVENLKGRHVYPMQRGSLRLVESFDHPFGVGHTADEKDLAVLPQKLLELDGHSLFPADVQGVFLGLFLPDGSKSIVIELRTDLVDRVRIRYRVVKRGIRFFEVDVHKM